MCSKTLVMAVNGQQLSICGEAEVHLQIGGHKVMQKVLVVEKVTQLCLLGTDYLENIPFFSFLRKRILTARPQANVIWYPIVIMSCHY